MCMHPDRTDSEVTVHNAYGEYPTQMSRASGTSNDSCPSTVIQLRNEPHGSSPDYDVEGRNEKWIP